MLGNGSDSAFPGSVWSELAGHGGVEDARAEYGKCMHHDTHAGVPRKQLSGQATPQAHPAPVTGH